MEDVNVQKKYLLGWWKRRDGHAKVSVPARIKLINCSPEWLHEHYEQEIDTSLPFTNPHGPALIILHELFVNRYRQQDQDDLAVAIELGVILDCIDLLEKG